MPLCSVCGKGVSVLAGPHYVQHVNGAYHQQYIKSMPQPSAPQPPSSNYCTVCKCPISNSPQCWILHQNGKAHKKAVATHAKATPPPSKAAQPARPPQQLQPKQPKSRASLPTPNPMPQFPTQCVFCKFEIPNMNNWNQHVNGRVHRMVVAEYEVASACIRCGATVVGLPAWAVHLSTPCRPRAAPVHPARPFQPVQAQQPPTNAPRHPRPQASHNNPPRKPRPYRFHKSTGSKPRNAPARYQLKLKVYPVPGHIEDMIATTKEEVGTCCEPLRKASRKHATDLLGPPSSFQLTATNASTAIRTLLHVEEAEITNGLHMYDIDEVLLTPTRSGMFEVKVDGLAEKRPSVMRGDVINAIDVHGNVHTGYAHFVHADNVVISFCTDSVNSWTRYLIEFTIKRIEFQLQHRALEHGTLFLDGPTALAPLPTRAAKVTPYPAHIATLNEAQREFVDFALNSNRRVNILWGPPGTGKTTTLVRYLQALLATLQQPDRLRKVVVCTPSNASADNLCEGLHKLGLRNILRVVSFSRLHGLLPKSIRRYALPAGQGEYLLKDGHVPPTEQQIRDADVIVVTLGSMGRLYGMHPTMKCSHFIVDEAGQATEAEMGLGLVICDEKTSRIVLAGDPKQLGPVTQSGVAKQYGFNVSPLERLLNMDDVKKHCCHMLKINYRSHPSILSIVNLHYDNILRSPADLSQGKFINGPLNFAGSRSKRIRLLHASGPESQEPDSPSIMNAGEIIEVVKMITSLLKSEPPSSIVVLTPYLKQSSKIKNRIHSAFILKGLLFPGEIEVCTIEAFQGREAKNIIISCVRSRASTDTIQKDIQRHLGFLKQPQRANVAISRAIDRLWIVGNWNLLEHDEVWGGLMRHAVHTLGIKVETSGLLPYISSFGASPLGRLPSAVDDDGFGGEGAAQRLE